MPKVLVVSAVDLRPELGRTVLWRADIERAFAKDVGEATAREGAPPNLIVLDAASPDSRAAIQALRAHPSTRASAIAAVSHNGLLEDAEGLRQAGANVVIPAHADPVVWDARLEELLRVPRRREARIPVRMETWSRLAEGGDFVEGSAINISVNGLLFESGSALEVGTKLDLRFRLPGHEDELQALGEVVRQDERPRSGIRFLVLRGDAREAIRAFVESGVASLAGPRTAAAATPEVTEWEAALRASEALKAAILESAPDPVLIMSHEGRIVEVNRAAEEVLGYARAQLVGKTIAETIAPPSDEHPHHRALAHHVATGGGPLLGQRIEMTARRADGGGLPVELAVSRTRRRGMVFFTAYLRDLTNLKRAASLQAALLRISDASAIEDMDALYAAIHQIIGGFMDAQNFYIALRDDSGRLSFPYFADEADPAPPSAEGAPTLTEFVLRTGEPLLASPSVFSDMVRRGEVELVGSPSVDWIGVPLKSQGRTFGVLAVQTYDPAVRYREADRDMLASVSDQIAIALERKRAEARIEHLAYHDQVTGLANRRLLLDRLDMALAQARRDSSQIAVLFLDIDRFKVINDSLGHAVGDEVLRAVAQRLKGHIRRGDTLARMGGDEFTAVIRGVRHPGDTAKVAETILDAIGQPLLVSGRELFVTAGVGISIFPEDGDDAETLLRNADIALHRAKEQGLDAFRLFQASMNEEAVQRLRLENDLRRALARNELAMHYQPIVDLATGRVQAMEALLRWHHPDHGTIQPSQFIPAAERTGLLASIGPWVLSQACAQAQSWPASDSPPPGVTVNISVRQLQNLSLVQHVKDALQASGLDPARLELEITETSAMLNPDATVQTLTAVKALGVRISVDDFGMGYSSLSQLQRLPIDILKIDRSFVHDVTADPGAAAIASTIITLAHSLGLKVVAEGVETAEQLAFLSERRCDRVQGYLISRPIAADGCRDVLAAHEPAAWRRPVEPIGELRTRVAAPPFSRSGTRGGWCPSSPRLSRV
ncbi:MAG TPA: EAL domain-containing protein, partial [Vicinamibacteria bacterium]|nr:EAL domain-containing protein [Vicinamibacteria bacterium]